MTTKRFLKLQIIFAIMLMFALVCNTFAWSQRPAVYGGGFMSIDNTEGSDTHDKDKSRFTAFSFDTRGHNYYINGNGCTAKTYLGTVDSDGNVTYPQSTATGNITSLASDTYSQGDVLYFKTYISNSKAFVTNTSLFIDVKYSTALENKYFIGVSSPTKDLITYPAESTQGNLSTVRWIPVVAQYEISANAQSVEIEWYVTFTGNGSFEITNIVLTNN